MKIGLFLKAFSILVIMIPFETQRTLSAPRKIYGLLRVLCAPSGLIEFIAQFLDYSIQILIPSSRKVDQNHLILPHGRCALDNFRHGMR